MHAPQWARMLDREYTVNHLKAHASKCIECPLKVFFDILMVVDRLHSEQNYTSTKKSQYFKPYDLHPDLHINGATTKL